MGPRFGVLSALLLFACLQSSLQDLPCPDDSFSCGGGYCIEKTEVCNGHNDCEDGSDERHCEKTCHGFLCGDGNCILEEFKCDGDPDCADKSDEKNCGKGHSYDKNCTLDNGEYHCKDLSLCIPFRYVCDGNPDCDDKSDEGGLCKSAEHNCMNANCTGSCANTPEGPHCFCQEGLKKDDNKCHDLDECHLFHDACSQICINNHGSYSCDCAKGYKLKSDGRTCEAEGGGGILIYSIDHQIKSYNITTKEKRVIQKDRNLAVGVTFDGEYVYWTELRHGSESIWKSKLDGSDTQVVVRSGIDSPEDIAVDWYTENIYFTDAGKSQIVACSKDGLHCTVVFNNKMEKPRGIILNPPDGEMYWTDWGSRAEIAKAYMDGSNDVTIAVDVYWPNGLALDYPNKRLYWSDGQYNQISSVKLDGTDEKVVLKYIGHPFSIAIFEDQLYWSNWGPATDVIQKCNKFTGKEITLIDHSKRALGLHAYHPSTMIKKKNPCSAQNTCTHICLLKGNDSYTCACPQGQILERHPNGKQSCKEVSHDRYVVVASPHQIHTIHHREIGRHDIYENEFPTMYMEEMVYDSRKDRLIVFDLYNHSLVSIESFDRRLPRVTPLVYTDIKKVTGLEIDYVTNNLYWCDEYKGTVEVMNLETKERNTIYHHNYDHIIDLALIPKYGFMYVALKMDDGSIEIMKMDMDGKNPDQIVMKNGIMGPFVKMLYDQDHLIYISDSGGKRIEVIDIEGLHLKTFRSLHHYPGTMTMLRDEIFWTKLMDDEIYWLNVTNPSNHSAKISLKLDYDVGMLHLASVSESPEISFNGKVHPCMAKACSHLCVQSSSRTLLVLEGQYTCLCPDNMFLNNNSQCEDIKLCARQYRCFLSNECVDLDKTCDFKWDCPMGEDEMHCPSNCTTNQFQCRDGKCVDQSNRCNGKAECFDKSDEENCEYFNQNSTCLGFKCKTGECLENSLVCNYFPDCPDGDDEFNCDARTCKEDEFRCNNGMCILKNRECDKQQDCLDLSDEHNSCPYNLGCTSSMFQCIVGGCINRTDVCNGWHDCPDGSDENSCDAPERVEGAACLPYEYTCPSDNRICLSHTAECNGTKECPLGEDEEGCESNTCPINYWKCKNGQCIPNDYVCNNVKNCEDNSDESPSSCNVSDHPYNGECKDGFKCKNGDCLDYKFVCNKYENCLDGSDEGPNCDSACRNMQCSDFCQKTPTAGICTCRQGRILAKDGYTCVDPPPACVSNPCDQYCTNTKTFRTCSCFEGYSLMLNGKSCKANGEPMTVVYISGPQVVKGSIKNKFKTTLSENTTLTSLDVCTKENSVIISVEQLGSVYKTSFLKNEKTCMNNFTNPGVVTLDWITGNVYVAVKGEMYSSILVCRIEENKCSRILKFAKGTIGALRVDPINKVLFCALNGEDSKIYKYTLDGRTEVTLSENITQSRSLAIDYNRKFLYFTNLDKIEYVNYEGTVRNEYVKTNRNISDIDFFEDKVYYITENSTDLNECNKMKCMPKLRDDKGIDTFVINQSNKQRVAENLCANNTCTYLCVPVVNDIKCLCPNGESIAQGEMCPQTFVSDLGFIPDMQYFTAESESSDRVNPTNKALLSIGILVALAVFTIGAYYIYKYQKKGAKAVANRNISVHFQNPTFGTESPGFRMNLGGISSIFPSLLKSNQNEYVNPLGSKSAMNLKSKAKTSQKACSTQPDVPKLLADSDSDVESERDFHGGDKEKMRLIP